MLESTNAVQRKLNNNEMSAITYDGCQAYDDKVLGKYDFPEVPEKNSKKSKKHHSSITVAEEHNFNKLKRARKFDKDSKARCFNRKLKKERKEYNDQIRQQLTNVRLNLAEIQKIKATLEDITCIESAKALSVYVSNYNMICMLEKVCFLAETRLKNPRKKDFSYKTTSKREDYIVNRYYSS